MPDRSQSEADADAADAARPPATPTTPSTLFSGSFHSRLSPARSFNLHALGFNASPLGPLGRRISFYGGDGDSSGDDDDGDERERGPGHLDEGFSNDSSSIGGGRGWQTSDDGEGGDSVNIDYGEDDPIALEDRKDVLIDRLNDMVRHVTSYAPSSPSLSNRSVSTRNSPGKSAAEAGGSAEVNGGETVLTALHAHIDKMEAVLAAAQAAEAAALAASPKIHRFYGHRRYHSHPKQHLWQQSEQRSQGPTAGAGGETQAALFARRMTLDAAPILFRAAPSSLQSTQGVQGAPKEPDRAVQRQKAGVSFF